LLLQDVPPFLSFIKTEAFGKGLPFSSLTIPETVCANVAVDKKVRNKIAKNLFID